MDRPGVCQVPEGSGEQGKMEKTGCKIICGAPTTLAVKGLMMMIMTLPPQRLGVLQTRRSGFLCEQFWHRHSLMLSVQQFLCWPRRLPPSKMPLRMVWEKLSWCVACPNCASVRLLTVARRGSCGPTRELKEKKNKWKKKGTSWSTVITHSGSRTNEDYRTIIKNFKVFR